MPQSQGGLEPTSITPTENCTSGTLRGIDVVARVGEGSGQGWLRNRSSADIPETEETPPAPPPLLPPGETAIEPDWLTAQGAIF